MATWPASLPQTLLVEGLTRTRQPGRIRSDMDTGPAKQRNRFTATAKYFESAQLNLTGAQLTTFETFYVTTLGNGAASFTWIDPITDASATLRFKGEPEASLLRPDATPDNRLYRVALPLEVMP
jgi:hypothetical protein